MRVAILSFYQGFISRGVETFVHELSSRVDSSIDLKVYSPDSLPLKAKATSPNLLTYLYLDTHSLRIKSFAKETLAQLEKNPPDILMPLNNGWMSYLSKKFCKTHPTKLVLPGFAGISWEDKLNLNLNPDAFISCTQHQAKWAKTINQNTNINTINIGVNTDRFKPEGEKYKHGLTSPVILCVAGPQTYKRTELAIKAVSRIKNASLLLVGSQTKAMIKLGNKLLKNKFKNILVDYQSLDSVYRSCDLFTLPSESIEAYGITILEALASNLPVVVNNDPTRRELVGRVGTGTLTDPSNLDQYVKDIKRALKHGKNNQFRQQALKFSWENIVNQYQQLWKNLLK